MAHFTPYHPRPIRFLEVITLGNERIKLYSISCKNDVIDKAFINRAKAQLGEWLNNKNLTGLPVYAVSTLILHEGKEGCFAVLFWWTDENMLQLFAYYSEYTATPNFRLISDNGLVSCIWEMAVLWFERQAWVKEVLTAPHSTDGLSRYLTHHLNGDV